MKLTSQMKMARFQSFWIQMRKKPLNEGRKTGQTSRTKSGILLAKKSKKLTLYIFGWVKDGSSISLCPNRR
ncbi:hypothetical protein Hanom_Chr10g00959801 [Helianthus anomalus]